MKHILEYLKTKKLETKPDDVEDRDVKYKDEKKANDPDTWDVGDILCGTFGSTMSLPRWFKVVKRTNKQFTCIRLKGKIVSGKMNGQWKEIATEEKYDDKEYKGRVTKWGSLRIDDTLMHLWDGKTPLYCDDQD